MATPVVIEDADLLSSINDVTVEYIVARLVKDGRDLSRCRISYEREYDDGIHIYIRGPRLETQDEAQAREKREARCAQDREDRERREYERLKMKFDPPT